jgi:hypothetical protein
MNEPSFPRELEDLERRVAAQLDGAPAREPDPSLRSRILESVGKELHEERTKSRRTFAAALAAAALIVANLSSSAVLVTDCRPRLADGKVSIAQLADQIRELVPTLPEEEALRQARILGLASKAGP